MSNNRVKFIVGIDEVGRGPLAGPVTVGACVFPADKSHFVWSEFAKIRDSKKLSAAGRMKWLRRAKELADAGVIVLKTSFVSHILIDRLGISKAVSIAVSRSIAKTGLRPDDCEILLDGLLRAPDIFYRQKTIIKGDEKEPIIAMASVVAKVRRDARMEKLAKKYSRYGFEENKGYGTAKHIKILKKLGPCEIHRRSFIAGILGKN